jgi:hypothetical protein
VSFAQHNDGTPIYWVMLFLLAAAMLLRLAARVLVRRPAPAQAG